MSDLLNSASLVMIPSGYKEDVVYSQIPTDGSGDLSFTRASNGTRVNSAGLVEVAPWNFCDYSEDQTQWTSQNETTVTANSTTAPNGTTTADTVTPSTANDDHYRGIVLGQQVGALTAFIYVKPNGYNFFDWGIYNSSQYIVRATFDLVNLTYTFTNAGTATIESVGNGWLKCGISGTNASLTTMSLYYRSRPTGGTGAFAGNGTSGAFIWGAQLNIGSTAKPYFPTTDRLNVPRLTYQNGGGGCPSLLLEKQSTNLIAYSNADAGMAFNGTLTLNATTSPEGVSNGFSFLVNANANGGLSFITLTTSAQSYTFSAYLKGSVNGQKVRLLGDLNGTIETFTLTTDWVRYTKTFTGAVGAQSIYLLNGAYFSPSENNLYYAYGMQLEASSYATSLIPTSGSSATRVADACFKTGISSLIGQTEGTLYFELQRDNTDNDTRLQISDGSGLNWLFVSIETGLNPRAYCNVGGVNQFSVYGSPVSNSTHKVALAYKSNDFKVYIDGVAVITQTSGSVPACNRIDVGSASPSGPVVSTSVIKEVVLFPTRLTNAELAQLTA